jgi:branched-chain amino acid transport system permease protein
VLAGSGMPGWLLMLMILLCAIVVCAALNFAIEKLAYRPLRNAPRLAPLITAMGMSLLLQTLAMIIWKPNPKPFPSLLPPEPINLGGPVISVTQCLILGSRRSCWPADVPGQQDQAGPRDARHRREPARGRR